MRLSVEKITYWYIKLAQALSSIFGQAAAAAACNFSCAIPAQAE